MAKALRRLIPAPILQLRSYFIRQIQARKSPQDIFAKVYRAKAWDLDEHSPRPFFSGFGSHSQPIVDAYVEALKPVFERVPNAAVVDLGCGDFNVGRQVRPLCASYIACDVVPELINHNRRTFSEHNVDFRHLDIVADPLPAGDVALIRQVLQHLNNAQVAQVVAKLSAYKTVIVTEHLPSGQFLPNLDKATGGGVRLHGSKPSGVVLDAPPFNIRHRKSTCLTEISDEDGTIRTTLYEL